MVKRAAYASPSFVKTLLVRELMREPSFVEVNKTDKTEKLKFNVEVTGEGNSRRGLVVRADPTNGFASHYQLTIKTGLLTVEFRKFINGNPTVTLGSWLTSSLPGGIPQANSWHSLKIQAIGPAFRCFFDGNELLPPPTPDSDLASGWVGVYNFRFDLGGIQALFDDLLLSPIDVTPTARESWGDLKARYVR